MRRFTTYMQYIFFEVSMEKIKGEIVMDKINV